MMNEASPMETLFEKAENYGKTTVELLKLNAINKSSSVFSTLITQVVMGGVVVMFAFIISIGIALWVGERFGNSYYGFFVVGGCYALFGVVLYVFRLQWIKDPVNNAMINELLKNKSS